MEKKSNYFFIVVSKNSSFITYQIQNIKKIIGEHILIDIDGDNFDSKNLSKLLETYIQKNTEGKEILYIINNFEKISKQNQSKLLVTMENLKGNKSFIGISKDKNTIIDALISRSVLFEDNDSLFNFSMPDENLENVIKMINEKDIVSFSNYLDELTSMDEIILFSSDIANLLYEKRIFIDSLDELLMVISTAKLVNSPNIVRAKLLEVIF